MKKNKKTWTRITNVCCLCGILLLLICSCAAKKEENDKTQPSEQEEQVNNSTEQGEPEVLETLPADLEELSFIDFGMNGIEYKKGLYKGEYGGTTLDGTLISGKLTFSPKGDTHVMIGGKDPWGGFGISTIKKDEEYVLRLYDTNGDKKGWKFQPYFFHSDVAGVPLIGQELDLKVSIEYVDEDGDGVENDVKVGMWFGGKLYDNKYIYLNNYTNTGYSMGCWMTIYLMEDAVLIIN